MRAAKEAAEQADRAKTRFVAMVTHELRTPLNGILGYAQLLRLEGGLTGQQNARVSAMMRSGQHLFGDGRAVLEFASIESGRMALHPVPLSVRDLAEGLHRGDRTAGQRARTESAPRSGPHDAPRQIVADPARLHQVLLNLLGNAVKFTTAGGWNCASWPRPVRPVAPGGGRYRPGSKSPRGTGCFRTSSGWTPRRGGGRGPGSGHRRALRQTDGRHARL